MARRAPLDWDVEEDEWVQRGWHRGYGHVPAPPYPRGDFLAPEAYGGSSMRRSRSHGQAPAPNVYVYQGQRNESRSPSRDPSRRRSRHETEEIVDGLEDIAHEIRRGRSRDPSAYGWRDPSPARYKEMQLELARERDLERREWEREARDRELNQEQLLRSRAEIRRLKDRISEGEREDRWRSEEEKLRKEIELEKIREEVKRRNEELRREEEKERLWAEREKDERRRREEREAIWAEKEKEDREKKEERRRLKMELEAKEREDELERNDIIRKAEDDKRKKDAQAKAAQEAAVLAYEKKKLDDKKKHEELIAQIKIEEEKKKLEEKEEADKWKLKFEREEAEKKEKKKQKEEEVAEEMRKKLAKFGFQDNQIEAMIDPKKADKIKPGQGPRNALVPFQAANPTYIKVHRNHIDVETLRYYGLPWEYDAVDTNYIIILQEMDSKETDILFEHTRKLRRGHQHLLIEDRGRDHSNPQYAFVRRRKPSASPNGRRRSSPKRMSVMFGL